jgi:hypothetical protein
MKKMKNFAPEALNECKGHKRVPRRGKEERNEKSDFPTIKGQTRGKESEKPSIYR